jgi:hypothetical protein
MTSLREPGERVRLAGRPTSLARTPQTVPTAASHQTTRRSHGTGLGRDRHGVGPNTGSRGRQAATVHSPGRIETSPDRACPHGSPVPARNRLSARFLLKSNRNYAARQHKRAERGHPRDPPARAAHCIIGRTRESRPSTSPRSACQCWGITRGPAYSKASPPRRRSTKTATINKSPRMTSV